MEDNGHDPLEGVTPDGMIVTGAHTSRIVAEFRPVLDEAVDRLSSFDEGYSLYVYGSVATGTASVGRSDVDLVTVGLDAQSAQKLGETLSEKFRNLCRSVEIGAGQRLSYDGTSDESYGNRVFLRHYCVHLAGPDIRKELHDFPADTAAARGFNGDIGIAADKWRADLSDSKDLASLVRRISRKTLYAISSLVSIHDRTWTTDRVTASKRWREIMPEVCSEIDTLVLWGNTLTPALSREEVQNMLGGFITKVVDDFNEQIGLWKP